MRLRALRMIVAAAALATAPATAALAQPVVTPIEEVADSAEVRREGDALRHIPSNYLFPARLGEMPARKLIIYGPGDVSVQYSLRGGANGDGWIDLFVYPKDVPPAEEAAVVDQIIRERLGGERIAIPDGFGPAKSGVESGWYRARINDKPVVTHFLLAHHGDWAVKARFSMPVDAADDVRQRAAAVLADDPTRWR